MTATVLSIDTAGPVVGVGIHAAGRVAVRTERIQRGAERRLVPWARELCDDMGIALSDLEGVGVAIGPGAFTGIRVGMATAVGLGLGLGIPLYGCSSLRSRAQLGGSDVDVLSMLDARKGRVYAAVYRQDQLICGPGDVDPAVAIGWPKGAYVAVGEGAIVYADRIERGSLVANADDPAVDKLALLTAAAIASGLGCDPLGVAPTYLREPDAKPPRSLL